MQEQFESKLYALGEETIQEMAELDGGINNVIRGLRKHCYGISRDEDSLENIDFFYINESVEKPGFLFKLRFREENFYLLLFSFAIFLSKTYENLEPYRVYSTFIEFFRTFLESQNIFTTTTLQLKKFEGYNYELISTEPIEVIQNFEIEDFYKSILNAPKTLMIKENVNYLYVMINKDTGYFKIGRSTNPDYRERTLHSKEPSVSLLKIWECEKHIERELQKKFAGKKIRGEWYNLTIDDLLGIDKIVDELISIDANRGS